MMVLDDVKINVVEDTGIVLEMEQQVYDKDIDTAESIISHMLRDSKLWVYRGGTHLAIMRSLGEGSATRVAMFVKIEYSERVYEHRNRENTRKECGSSVIDRSSIDRTHFSADFNTAF